VGSGDDPNRISSTQVIADAKLYKQMAEDLKGWYQANKATMDLDARLKCLNFLREAVLQGLKFHLAPAKAAAPTVDAGEAFDVLAAYEEMIRGKD
jgi:hypothetical protein